jgi:hypothetical protein
VSAGPPADRFERAEYEEDMVAARSLAEGIPTSSGGGGDGVLLTAYSGRLRRWFDLLDLRSVEELFIPCAQPSCPIQVRASP